MLDMAKKSIQPAAIEYTKEMCDTVASMKAVGVDTSLEWFLWPISFRLLPFL